MKFNLDKTLIAEFEKIMAAKENDPAVQQMLKELASNELDDVDVVEISESDEEFLKRDK